MSNIAVWTSNEAFFSVLDFIFVFDSFTAFFALNILFRTYLNMIGCFLALDRLLTLLTGNLHVRALFLMIHCFFPQMSLRAKLTSNNNLWTLIPMRIFRVNRNLRLTAVVRTGSHQRFASMLFYFFKPNHLVSNGATLNFAFEWYVIEHLHVSFADALKAFSFFALGAAPSKLVVI